MFYEIVNALTANASADTFFRVFGYTSVRAGCALAFAFAISLMFGPACVRWLSALKMGQQVRQFKTSETQQFNIHQHKAGTPTMGGLLIVVATVGSALLFCDPHNSYVWLVLGVMLGAGALGFADDYMKVVRRNHKGVSGKTKLLVQIALGGALGAFLLWSRPHTAYGPLLLGPEDIVKPAQMAEKLRTGCDPLSAFLRGKLSGETLGLLSAIGDDAARSEAPLAALRRELNLILDGDCIYDPERFAGVKLNEEAEQRLEWHLNTPNPGKSTRLNRYLIESAFPEAIACNTLMRGDDHLLVPFFKNLYPALGLLFIPWVALVLAGTSNAVNLTDGLDGLAIGTVITVSLPYLLIVYLVSRFDYATYLYIPHVPQAGELGVFLSAMLGASMGFLWFNSHPAEMFMGDTGSLSLGATIGAIAVLCKHEILLVLIGGIFVVEALSVVAQVASYRLRGKRVLLMSPLHNHYVKQGMDEAKIISRFLIVATLLAMAGLSTLKLR